MEPLAPAEDSGITLCLSWKRFAPRTRGIQLHNAGSQSPSDMLHLVSLCTFSVLPIGDNNTFGSEPSRLICRNLPQIRPKQFRLGKFQPFISHEESNCSPR